MYKKTNAIFIGAESNYVIRFEDGAFIPFDPDNTDYQSYLKWVAEGNEPIPAEEPATPASSASDEGVA